MVLCTRRSILAALMACARSTALARASRGQGYPIPPVPLSFAVALEDDVLVRDAAWIEAQVARMESLFGPLGVHIVTAGVRSIAARYARMETREDRDALFAELRSGVANVFVVESLRDVDEPARTRRGVHWRNRARPSTRYVILSADAPETVLAHEMGHYFGLGHSQATDNLMSYDRTGGPVFLDAPQTSTIQSAAREAFRSGELVATQRTDRSSGSSPPVQAQH